MRAYFFTNMYLSSIQHGIQSLHCLQEMNNKYTGNDSQSTALAAWASEYKTAIVLNGGTSDQVSSILKLFQNSANTFAWGYFREPSMENMLTCVGIIVPDTMYTYDRNDYGTIENEIATLLRTKRFAK